MADSKFTAEENEFLDNAKDRGVTDAGQLAILLKQFQMKQRTQMPLPDATIPDLEKIGAEPKTKQPFMTDEQKMQNRMRRAEQDETVFPGSLRQPFMTDEQKMQNRMRRAEKMPDSEISPPKK